MKRILIFSLIAILFIGISGQAFGQIQSSIVVTTDKSSYSEGLISDNDFASGIEYLVQEGIIRV